MSSQRPLVSIVTPVYNGAKYVSETIDSVLEQGYPNIEHLVLDDGSTDDTPGILDEYQTGAPDRLRVFHHANVGQSPTVNKGFISACGDVLSWINADDFYTPGAVQEAVDLLEEDPTRMVVYSNTERIDADGGSLGYYPTRSTDIRDFILGDWSPFCHCSMFFRREVLYDVGLLDTSLPYCRDLDWLVRITMRHSLFYHQQGVWSKNRIHPGAQTANSRVKRKAADVYLHLYSKWLTMPELKEVMKGKKAEVMSLAYRNAASNFWVGGDKGLAYQYMLRSLLRHPRSQPVDKAKVLVKWALGL